MSVPLFELFLFECVSDVAADFFESRSDIIPKLLDLRVVFALSKSIFERVGNLFQPRLDFFQALFRPFFIVIKRFFATGVLSSLFSFS